MQTGIDAGIGCRHTAFGTVSMPVGNMLIVCIPMRFQRRGGRKRIVAPDGSELVRSSKPAPDRTLLKALARAWRRQRMLNEGMYTSVSEIGNAENMLAATQNQIVADLPSATLRL